jgi:transcriptional regulator with XRE-family HTH domain
MDVQVDSDLIRAERERRAWSQEHLAAAAGIGARTVQRVEATGAASYESLRAISAALEVPLARLRRDAVAPQPADTVAAAPSARADRPAWVPPARLRVAAGWLGGAAALVLVAGVMVFFLLHDYQKVRVLRAFEQWVTEPAASTASRSDAR